MQEEVNEKTVSLCITGGKVTVRLLKQAMMRFLAAIEKEKAEKARKQQVKGPPDKDYHGKQSLKKLAQQNVQLSNIEITDNNIKAFEKVAKKYGNAWLCLIWIVLFFRPRTKKKPCGVETPPLWRQAATPTTAP